MNDPESPEEKPSDELTEEELEEVTGGARKNIDVAKKPTPGGPLPVPYPNTSSTTKS
jgi:bacteriocin-like protein